MNIMINIIIVMILCVFISLWEFCNFKNCKDYNLFIRKLELEENKSYYLFYNHNLLFCLIISVTLFWILIPMLIYILIFYEKK